jgi:hypothetical protein
MSQRCYVLDTNVFVEAAYKYYAFDFNTPFWDLLLELGRDGKICTIDRVDDELSSKGDKGPLRSWFDASFSEFIRPSVDADTIAQYQELMIWSSSQDFLAHAKEEFARESEADAWLAAYAKAHMCTVVTFETFEPNRKNRVKLPVACTHLDVPFVDTFKMMRELGLRFRQ